MNTIRMIAVALPIMLLMACGGGGGSSNTARTPATTPMPMGDPNMPPPVTLPGYALDAAMARTRAGGTTPTSMTETEIITEIQNRATAADTFEFSDFVPTSCVNSNRLCTTGNIPNVGSLTFSLDGIEDLSLVDGDMGLMDFVSETQVVMEDAGATIIQSQSAAGQEDGTRLTFQTYGGWLADSVFGLEVLRVIEDGTTTPRYASFSFGDATGSNPTGGSNLTWSGVMIGRNTTTGGVIHGDLSVQYLTVTASVLDQIVFENVINLDDGSSFTFDRATILTFTGIPLTNGRFESATGDIKGSFYGTGHEEVGGIFNSGTHNIIGAFGGTKQ